MCLGPYEQDLCGWPMSAPQTRGPVKTEPMVTANVINQTLRNVTEFNANM